MEFTCSLLNIKLTEVFKVQFCTNYGKFIHIVLNFREKIYLTYLNLPACTHKHIHTHTHTHAHARTHTHAHTHMNNTVPVCEGIYLVLHIQFSCCPMQLLLVVIVNFHINNKSCVVTATRHAVLFHVCHLLMFYRMLHFYTSTFLYTLSVPQSLFTRSQSTHTGTITNGTMAHSHSTALLGSAVPLCNVTLRFN